MSKIGNTSGPRSINTFSSGDCGGQSPATVQSGETTLKQVAQRLGVDADSLQAANPQIRDIYNLRPGQDLRLPPSGFNPSGDSGPLQDGSGGDFSGKSAEKNLDAMMLKRQFLGQGGGSPDSGSTDAFGGQGDPSFGGGLFGASDMSSYSDPSLGLDPFANPATFMDSSSSSTGPALFSDPFAGATGNDSDIIGWFNSVAGSSESALAGVGLNSDLSVNPAAQAGIDPGGLGGTPGASSFGSFPSGSPSAPALGAADPNTGLFSFSDATSGLDYSSGQFMPMGNAQMVGSSFSPQQLVGPLTAQSMQGVADPSGLIAARTAIINRPTDATVVSAVNGTRQPLNPSELATPAQAEWMRNKLASLGFNPGPPVQSDVGGAFVPDYGTDDRRVFALDGMNVGALLLRYAQNSVEVADRMTQAELGKKGPTAT